MKSNPVAVGIVASSILTVVVGQSAMGAPVSSSTAAIQIFRKQVLLTADAKPIDTAEVWVLSRPTIAYFAGDGFLDVVLSAFPLSLSLF